MKVKEIENPAIKLDRILIKLCKLVVKGQEKDDYYYGMVAAAVVDPKGHVVGRLNYANNNQHRIHAERAAIDAYKEKYGSLPHGSKIVTTLSPCSNHMHDREGRSCTDLLNDNNITQVYCGYIDPTQVETSNKKKRFGVKETQNKLLQRVCKAFADTFI